MSFLLGVFASFQAGFIRLKEIARAFFQLVRPRSRVKCPPHVKSLGDTGERVVIITAPDAVSCPSVLPMMTPPIHECFTNEIKNGSQSARALFLDSFRPLSPMAVFEISSNAFSPSIADSIALSSSVNDTQSPLSINGNDSQSVAMFDQVHSPSQLSTAPTTPASDTFYLGHLSAIEGEFRTDFGCSLEEDDLPLSALMIHGVAHNSAKRNGISGDLLSNRKDAPLWVPAAQQSVTRPSPTVPDVSGDGQWEEVNIMDGLTVGDHLMVRAQASLSNTECNYHDLAPRVDTASCPISPPERPVNPLSWCDAWVPSKGSPNNDEDSVYSLDSFVPNLSPEERRLSRTPHIIPHITFTPPSLPTSPLLTPKTVNAMAAFEDAQYASVGVTAVRSTDELEPSDSALFKPVTTLVPFHSPIPRYHSDCHGKDANDVDDAFVIKRQRRNACRLTTSSIDIIMAGLDQEFPDTPITSPSMGPVDLGDDTPSSIDLQMGGVEPLSRISLPSSPSTIRHSVGDLSGETMFMEELESKFSDSSDEEQESDYPKIENNKTICRLSWPPVSQVPFFGPCSVLSTIVEEEEDGGCGSRDITPFDRIATVSTALEPPAIIDEGDRVSSGTSPVYRPPGKASKKRWFSMIEDKSRHANTLKGVKRKHMSVPVLTRMKTQPHLAPTTGTHFRIRSRARSSTIQEVRDRPKSAVHSLILPSPQVVTRRNVVAESEADNTSRFSFVRPSSVHSGDFSLPSSRSSSCISLYQRPWSLYIPAEPADDLEMKSSTKASQPVSKGPSSFASSLAAPDTPDNGPLSLGAPSPNNGLGGIIAILDTMSFQTAASETPCDETPDIAFETDAGITRWSYADFETYSWDSAGSDFFSGIAV